MSKSVSVFERNLVSSKTRCLLVDIMRKDPGHFHLSIVPREQLTTAPASLLGKDFAPTSSSSSTPYSPRQSC